MVMYSEKQLSDRQKVIHKEILISAKISQRTPKVLKIEQHVKKICLAMYISNTTISQVPSPLSTLLKTLPKPRIFASFFSSHLTLRVYLFLFHQELRVTFQRKSIYPVWFLSIPSFPFNPVQQRRQHCPTIPLYRQRRGEAVKRDE